MNSPQSGWRYRLRGDPAAWLLDEADNPSVYFWFQRDIVGRPEDSPSLVSAREQILFSPAVQQVFDAQDTSGFWESPASLDLPRYRSTLWALATLAELGLARTSRRARLACEMVIQNHLNADGALTGLRDLSVAGLLVRTLGYFLPGDPRLIPACERLAPAARSGNVYATWALAEARHPDQAALRAEAAQALLDAVANGAFRTVGAFPPFDPGDLLLAARVIMLLGRLDDPRAVHAIDEIWQRQQQGARWRLEKDYGGETIGATLEPAGPPSKWATLAALRVLTRTK
jgi:hypothetical protein